MAEKRAHEESIGKVTVSWPAQLTRINGPPQNRMKEIIMSFLRIDGEGRGESPK